MSIQRIQRGRNHAYTINDHRAVGVTTALSNGWPKPGLLSWAARCAAEEAYDLFCDGHPITEPKDAVVARLSTAHVRLRGVAAVRGTKVHKIAQQLIVGDALDDIPEDLDPYVQSCLRFMDEWKVRPLLVEQTVGSYRWGYAGTFDLIGELPDGRRILWDYKTGKSIFPETALQLAAYRWADAYVAADGTEILMKEVGVTEAKVVHLRPDGYDVIPLNTDGTVFKTFLHVLQVAKARDVVESWKGAAETPPPKTS